MLKHTTGLSLIILLTLSLLLVAMPVWAQKDRIEVIRKTVLMSFGNEAISTLILNYTFLLNSTVIVSNNFGDQLIFSLPSGSWTQNATHVLYHCISVSSVDVVYAFDITKNQSCKISMVGSAAATVAFPLKFSDVKLENLTLWNGNIGFNFSDIESKSTFNSRNSVLSISLSGSFNLDPTIVDSNMATATVTNQSPQRKTVHDAASNYFAYYANETQIIAEYSTDGVSWENTRQIMVDLALTQSSGNIFDIDLYSESGSLVYIAIAYVVANTTSRRNVLYYRSDIFTKATSTWTLGTVYTILNYSLTTEHRLANPVISRYGSEVFVAFSKSAQAGLKMLVWSTYKSTDGGASWASASIDKTWMLAGSAYDCWGGFTLMNNVNADRYMLYESPTYVWKGRYYNSSTSAWAAEETPISITPNHYVFGLNAYNNTVYASFATYIPVAIFPQFVVRNTSGSWLTPETFTTYQSRAGVVVLSVNASTGDAYAIWRNGNGSATQLLTQKRTFAGAWDSNVTQWFSDSNSYEAGFASMRNTYLDVIPFMFPSAPVGNWTLQYALLNFTAPAAGLAWFNASTFNFILNTRTWLNASYLNLLLNTRAWLNASSLALLLNTRSWLEAATLNFQLDTKGWYDAATFYFELTSSQAYLIIPILFLALLIFGVLAIAILYKRKGS